MFALPPSLSRASLRSRARALVRRARHGASWARRHPRRVLAGVGLLLALPFLLIGVIALFTPLPPELREPAPPSLRVLARDGRLLREVRTDDGAKSRPLPLAEFPPHVRNAVLAAEDRHFYSHVGIDVLAIARAVGANVWHRRVVSGASTITMQLARTVRPHKRSMWGKLCEAALAVRIEASLSKDQILEQYLNRVIYGPNVRGYAAASHAYFGVPPKTLSLAEAALIAGLPRGPSLYQVTKRPDLAKRRRDRILDRMAQASMIDAGERERATSEKIAVTIDKPSFGAPHFVRGIVKGTPSVVGVQRGLTEALEERSGVSSITTTLDPEIQKSAEAAVTTTLAALTDKHVTAASVVVIENTTGDVLAWVGSPDFFSETIGGQNDGVVALRQPGSSLKPFVYAKAMTKGFTGSTVLPDVEIHIPLPGGGDYVPHDYDTKQRGPVRLREALGNSLNIPAVYTIQQLGTAPVLDLLHDVGFASLKEDAEHYGPALALGDGEVTLIELANAYATLARGGVIRSPRIVSEVTRGDADVKVPTPMTERRVLDERVAAMITDILSDKNARTASFGDQNVLELEFEVAAKTGTSKGFRDNITVGYTRDLTVAVWAGNFDGSPMVNVSGISGAGPIFQAVMEAAHDRYHRALGPAGAQHRRLALDREEAERLGLARATVCALSGEIASASCPHRIHEWLPAGAEDHEPTCSVHERVRIDVRSGLRAGPQCPSSVTETRVLERWNAPYLEWAERTNRPLIPQGSSDECPVDDVDPTAAGGAPQVVYPLDRSRFAIDPDRPRSLQLLFVKVAPEGPDVEVDVDGVSLPKTREWELVAGDHVITAHRRGVAGPPVRISVRDAN